jgi:hypothetical protein
MGGLSAKCNSLAACLSRRDKFTRTTRLTTILNVLLTEMNATMPYFDVTLYHANEMTGCDISDQYKIPLTRLCVGTIEAPDARSAAAQVWIASVGEYRVERMHRLNVPQIVRDVSVSEAEIIKQLRATSLCTSSLEGFLLDNQVEVWLIGVNRGESPAGTQDGTEF